MDKKKVIEFINQELKDIDIKICNLKSIRQYAILKNQQMIYKKMLKKINNGDFDIKIWKED